MGPTGQIIMGMGGGGGVCYVYMMIKTDNEPLVGYMEQCTCA